MKLTSFTLILIAMVLGFAFQTSAQDKPQEDQDKTKTELSTPADQNQVGPNFIDEDGDGVCDRQNDQRRMHRRDHDGNNGRHMGRCGRGNRHGHDESQHQRRQAGTNQK